MGCISPGQSWLLPGAERRLVPETSNLKPPVTNRLGDMGGENP